MKAVVVNKAGDPEVLEYTDVPTPEVKAGWSLIRVKGFGVNHSEIFTREGKSPSVKFPRILGIEAVGIIDKSTDKSLKVGQTVMTFMGEMGRTYDGSYAEYVLVPNKQIFPITTKLPWSDLAAIPETYYTAYGALIGLQIHTGDSLLIRAGTSGVGVSAAKLAKEMGNITVTSTTRNIEKSHRLYDIGVDNVVLDDNGNLQTTQKFDKILDLMGPKTVPNSLSMLNKFGIVSSTGQLGGVWDLDNFDPIAGIPNNCYLTSFYSGEVDVNLLKDLIKLIEDKNIDVSPTKIFKLNEVSSAHAYLQSGHSFGKVVVLP
ncbi:zinc-binding alcohol dehydrogenase family protein [Companilactobacillus jidongensis]|uniref:zinc-binding alcohol dehydrogenase family protein n=1 Tax=Companilactobacillus jidongensis TaxID=2486006 RepID=UPI000F773518|nr:zinc-binding alcohol dehydrogenase family protein [Companilactobacillus jidongensis]